VAGALSALSQEVFRRVNGKRRGRVQGGIVSEN